MPNLDNLTKLHATRKHLIVEKLAYEQYLENKQKAWKRWLEKSLSTAENQEQVAKEALEMFEKNFPPFEYKEGDKITQ